MKISKAIFVFVFGLSLLFPLSGSDLDWLPEGFPAADESMLCTRSYLSQEMGTAVLDAAVEEFDTKEKWEQYRGLLRERILQGAGLSPFPRKTELRPIVHSRREYDGYSVENVAIETVPGYWATGNLFRPLEPRGKVPAILNTHGHAGRIRKAEDWLTHGRFHEQNQRRGAALAKMGAVVFSIDMFAYGDGIAQVGEDAHRSETAMRIQLWNAIRALDFLESLPEVDPERLGVTGYSGGGTQAFLLAAVEDRIKATAPVAMVSAHFFGGCPCESGRPVHRSADHFASNAMIAAMAAPRPQILISDGGDWTLNTPQVEYPFLRKIYQLYGAENRVSNVHLADEGHNYGPNKRKAMYPFFANAFDLDLSAILNSLGEVDDSQIVVESPERLRVFDETHRVPVGGARSAAEVGRALDRLQQSEATASISVYELRCDSMLDPLGVDSERPVLSWKLESDEASQRQSAYQIRVASRVDLLGRGEADIWDSGRVVSARQNAIPYEGARLGSRQQVFWSARVWDAEGKPSDWSKMSRWTMGVLKSEDWGNAKWIAHPRWLEEKRAKLGFRSESAKELDTPKWLEIDLGREVSVDTVRLHALRHTVAERLGFPTVFKVLLSRNADFSDAYTVVDYTRPPHTNKWFTEHDFTLSDPLVARFFRIEVERLRDLDGEICFALSQVEILSEGINVALGARVTASDSVENDLWSAAAVVDGKGVPGSNPLGTKTVVLQRGFEARAGIIRAIVSITGLGQYALYINGVRVGEEVLSPGWTDTDETVLYDTKDVAEFLREGINELEVRLAGGMYSVGYPEGRYTKFVGRFRPLMALVNLRVEYADGSVQEVASDELWKASIGATLYSHVYGGEDFDARIELRDWVQVGIAEGPRGRLKGASFAAPPVVGHERLTPVSVDELREGVYVYDFGQNAAMMPEIWVKGEAGARVRMIPGELLDEDGTVDRGSSAHGGKLAYWLYTLGKRGEAQTWKPEFFYHGARYLQVELTPANEEGDLPEVISIESVVTHSSSEPAGHFACSSELFNRTRDLVRWAQRSNMVSVLTDCPHRERLGWLEQYHLNGPSLRYEFDMERLYKKVLGDMVDAQTEAGLVPNVAPEFITFDGAFRDSPEWGSSLILAAWQQYLWTGDESVLRSYYVDMKGYVDYLSGRASGHLLSHGLGDWYDLGPERPGFAQLTPVALTATAIYFEDVETMGRVAGLLGQAEDEAFFRERARAIKEAFNEAFFYEGEGHYGAASQTGNAMAYVLGLVPERRGSSVLEAIVSDIRTRGNALSAGDVGHRYLLLALQKAGRSDVIMDMHHQSDRPGYGMQLAKGATSLTEAWDAGKHSSQDHFMLGHIMEWFYGGLAGIGPDPAEPGFARVLVEPEFVEGIDWVEARVESVRGPIELRWRKDQGKGVLDLRIPTNVEARLTLPGGYEAKGLYEGSSATDCLKEHMDGRRGIRLGSGCWRLPFEAVD